MATTTTTPLPITRAYANPASASARLYQQAQSVLQPDAPVATARTWAVEAGVLGPQEA